MIAKVMPLYTFYLSDAYFLRRIDSKERAIAML